MAEDSIYSSGRKIIRVGPETPINTFSSLDANEVSDEILALIARVTALEGGTVEPQPVVVTFAPADLHYNAGPYTGDGFAPIMSQSEGWLLVKNASSVTVTELEGPDATNASNRGIYFTFDAADLALVKTQGQVIPLTSSDSFKALRFNNGDTEGTGAIPPTMTWRRVVKLTFNAGATVQKVLPVAPASRSYRGPHDSIFNGFLSENVGKLAILSQVRTEERQVTQLGYAGAEGLKVFATERMPEFLDQLAATGFGTAEHWAGSNFLINDWNAGATPTQLFNCYTYLYDAIEADERFPAPRWVHISATPIDNEAGTNSANFTMQQCRDAIASAGNTRSWIMNYSGATMAVGLSRVDGIHYPPSANTTMANRFRTVLEGAFVGNDTSTTPVAFTAVPPATYSGGTLQGDSSVFGNQGGYDSTLLSIPATGYLKLSLGTLALPTNGVAAVQGGLTVAGQENQGSNRRGHMARSIYFDQSGIMAVLIGETVSGDTFNYVPGQERIFRFYQNRTEFYLGTTLMLTDNTPNTGQFVVDVALAGSAAVSGVYRQLVA